MLLKLATALLPFAVAVTNAAQLPFSTDHDDYQVLTYKSHPNYRLSLKRHEVSVDASVVKEKESVSKYCAGATSGYTGYLSTDNDSKHFYFAFFESRSKPKEDPLVLWMNGGPGCSSMTVCVVSAHS